MVMCLTYLALKMAEKHESNPSLRNNGEFRHRVEVGSASSWTAFSLEVFRAVYEKDNYEKLPAAVYEHNATDAILEQRNTR